MLNGELTTELGYEKHSSDGDNTGNSRNGYSEKTLKEEHGELTISVPRDRNGEFEPKIITKNQTRLNSLDEKIISLYAKGMTTRDTQEQLKDLYDVEISATMISNVTNKVMDEVKAWQSRPLNKVYPIFFLDAAALKQLYLALKNISKKWTMPIHDWKSAMNCFSIMFEDRWQ